ncbi:MAG: HAD family hydrolase [Planctomycetota bacterium]|nr:HAD family hydrolase [Planctomycetota bacterium]
MASALVVFDLDDTLIDTKGTLLPAALRRTADALGIAVEALDSSGKTVEQVVSRLAPLARDRLEAARAAWYDPQVPPLTPLPGARDLIARLRGRVHLVLLTRGAEARQNNKIDATGLRSLFDVVVIRSVESDGSKRDDLLALMQRFGVPARRCVVVGDDPDDELAHAADLGCRTIRVPETPLPEIPDRLRAFGLLS